MKSDDLAKILNRLEAIEEKLNLLTAGSAPRRDWYLAKEVAQILGYKTSRSVLRLIERGELGATLTDRGYIVTEAALKSYLDTEKANL